VAAIDRFQDTIGRIPHLGDRVRVIAPQSSPYWARLRSLYVCTKRDDLVAVLEDERTAGTRYVLTDYVTRASDRAQRVRPASETSAIAAAFSIIARRRRGR
jgi:hypothetical protein